MSIIMNMPFYIICSLIVFAPLARGSVHPWATTIIQIGIVLAAIFTVIENFSAKKNKPARGRKNHHPDGPGSNRQYLRQNSVLERRHPPDKRQPISWNRPQYLYPGIPGLADPWEASIYPRTTKSRQTISAYPSNRQSLDFRYPCPAANKQKQHDHPALPPRMDPG